MEIDDEDAGGHLDAGLQTLSGDQALILCRSRHAYDEYGDGRLLPCSEPASRPVRHREENPVGRRGHDGIHRPGAFPIRDYGSRDFRHHRPRADDAGLDPATDIYSAMEPTTSKYINDVWYEINNVDEWKKMMTRVNQGLPPTDEDIVDEMSNTVLANHRQRPDAFQHERGRHAEKGEAHGQRGGAQRQRHHRRGHRASERIEELGYSVESGNADSFDYPKTLVIYDDEAKASRAQEIADALALEKP